MGQPPFGSTNDSCNSDVALYAACIMPHLVLPKTKTEIDGSISKIIGRRLKQWTSGKIEDLLEEPTALQRRLTKTTKAKKDFNSLVEKENYHRQLDASLKRQEVSYLSQTRSTERE